MSLQRFQRECESVAVFATRKNASVGGMDELLECIGRRRVENICVRS